MKPTGQQIVVLLIALLLCASCSAQSTNQIAASEQSTTPSKPVGRSDSNKFALIIGGASGEEAYAKQFDVWISDLNKALTTNLGFPAQQVKILSEKPVDPATARATADEVKLTFAALKSSMQPENVLFIFLIGHGTFDGKEAKFNLVGPDLSAVDYNHLLSSLPTRRIVIFNMASASGEFIKSLSAKGRIVVTATRNGQEQNATRFAGFFIAALKASDADTDQDGHISVLEAFTYANRLTADFYARAGRLATEHALFDDNGDGVGREKADGGEGLLARATYLDSLDVAEAAANAATAKLLHERTRLEGEIEQLIGRKSAMPESEYQATLERLLIELAKVNRSIKQAGS
jgi:hypothetical protein